MNPYQKLQEYHPSFRSLSVDTAEEKQLMPLFDHILGGLESYKNKLAQTAARLVGEKYSDSYRKEETQRVASESREKVKTNSLLVLDRIKTSLGVCETAVATVMEKNISDPIERLLVQLQDQEIRGHLSGMSQADRVAVLFDTAKVGNESVMRAVKSQPATQQLIPSSDIGKAYETYTEKVASAQVGELALMKNVTEKASVAVSLMDVSLSNIDQQAGIASKMSVKAY